MIKGVLNVLTHQLYRGQNSVTYVHPGSSDGTATNNASFSLLLPGKVLYFNALNELRKFRGRGNKVGAKQAWECLEKAGLGTFVTRKAARGTTQVGCKLLSFPTVLSCVQKV